MSEQYFDKGFDDAKNGKWRPPATESERTDYKLGWQHGNVENWLTAFGVSSEHSVRC
jgi:hypothetical protein